MLIDISSEDFLLLDGVTIPIATIRAVIPLMSESSHCTIETQSLTTQVLTTRRDPIAGTVTTLYGPRNTGTNGQPIQTSVYAELVSPPPQPQTRIVERDSPEFDDLIEQGWKESGRTKPRQVRATPPNASPVSSPPTGGPR